jgi:hypothetical protein
MLNDHGRLLYQSLKKGSLPPTLEIKEAFTHRIGRFLFLSPLFAKTVQPVRFLPVSILVLVLGAVGSAWMHLDPMLFFYFQFSAYEFEAIVALFLFNWLGLFIFSDMVIYLLNKRVGNELQLFVCLSLAAFPLALFPYITMFVYYEVARYLLLVLQVWSLLLISSAFCFGKGLRLDKSILISMSALYVNIILLMVLHRFP